MQKTEKFVFKSTRMYAIISSSLACCMSLLTAHKKNWRAVVKKQFYGIFYMHMMYKEFRDWSHFFTIILQTLFIVKFSFFCSRIIAQIIRLFGMEQQEEEGFFLIPNHVTWYIIIYLSMTVRWRITTCCLNIQQNLRFRLVIKQISHSDVSRHRINVEESIWIARVYWITNGSAASC